MAKITNIKGRQVFDSRGNPTVEAEVFLENGISASAIVPSGASTGKHEAFELRDKDNQDYLGKSVFQAVEIINGIISKNLKGFSIYDLEKIDKYLTTQNDNKKEKLNEIVKKTIQENLVSKHLIKELIKEVERLTLTNTIFKNQNKK